MYHQEQKADEVFGGEVELDESYFGGRRKGKRGRGSAGKVPVFGLLKRGGEVYTKIIPDASSATLMPIIKHKLIPDSIVYTDCWRVYNALDVTDQNQSFRTVCRQEKLHVTCPSNLLLHFAVAQLSEAKITMIPS